MGLRVKLRRTFTSKKNNTDNSTTTKEEHYTSRTDIEYYKPHEIPKSKYRGKVDPEHQASLASFSLAGAFSAARRRSSLALSGTFSPGGTKAQSRAASRVQSRAQSRRPSWVSQRGSTLRTKSTQGQSSEGSDSSMSTSREKSVAASTALGVDTANTSLSDQPTAVPSVPAEPGTKLAQHDSGIDIPRLELSKQVTAHDTPFTVEELEKAMSRAALKPREFDFGAEAGVRRGEIGVAL